MQSTFLSQLQNVPGIEATSPSRFIEVRVASSSVSRSKNGRDKLILTSIEPAAFRQIGDMVFTTGKTTPDDNWRLLGEDRTLFISSVVADGVRHKRRRYDRQ
jgi:hypothetical protein